MYGLRCSMPALCWFNFFVLFFFFKQKTAYEMRISDWSSDVCSSDLRILLQMAERCVAGAEIVQRDPHARRRQAVQRPLNLFGAPAQENGQIGRASCRERVCQYV